MTDRAQYDLAARVRDACIQTATSAYQNASMSGLCGEGAFEAAISAMRMMDLEAVVSLPADRGSDR